MFNFMSLRKLKSYIMGQVGVEVDDHVHRLDVDAPGEEVRGNQTPASSLTEVVEHSIPVGLVHPRVDEEA